MFAKGEYEGEGVAVEGAPPVGDVKLTPMALERARNAIMVKLRKKGYPTRAIARILGMSQPNVVRRMKAIPPRVLERYAKVDLL